MSKQRRFTCIWCGGQYGQYVQDEAGDWSVFCGECAASGPHCHSKQEARRLYLMGPEDCREDFKRKSEEYRRYLDRKAGRR